MPHPTTRQALPNVNIGARTISIDVLNMVAHEYGHRLNWAATPRHNDFGQIGDPDYYKRIDDVTKSLTPLYNSLLTEANCK